MTRLQRSEMAFPMTKYCGRVATQTRRRLTDGPASPSGGAGRWKKFQEVSDIVISTAAQERRRLAVHPERALRPERGRHRRRRGGHLRNQPAAGRHGCLHR